MSYKYYLNIGAGAGTTTQVYPSNSDSLRIVEERQDNRSVREVLDGSVILQNRTLEGTNDYSLISGLDTDDEIRFIIRSNCDDYVSDRWKGYFSLIDGKHTEDNCTFETDVTPDDDYRIIEETSDTEINILNATHTEEAYINMTSTPASITTDCVDADVDDILDSLETKVTPPDQVGYYTETPLTDYCGIEKDKEDDILAKEREDKLKEDLDNLLKLGELRLERLQESDKQQRDFTKFTSDENKAFLEELEDEKTLLLLQGEIERLNLARTFADANIELIDAQIAAIQSKMKSIGQSTEGLSGKKTFSFWELIGLDPKKDQEIIKA